MVSVEEVIEGLQNQVTAHAGTAPAKMKYRSIKSLQKHFKEAPDDLYSLAVGLCDSGNATGQEIGVVLVTDFYRQHEEDVSAILQRLANSENWEVREWAASACGTVLEANFQRFYPVLRHWVTSDEENIRRAVVLAAMYAGKSRNPSFIRPLLKLLEPLMADSSKYVRDNLGPFALGSALMTYYPEDVLLQLRDWATSDDAQVRWNVAMAFSAAGGAQYAHKARDILAGLYRDEQSDVQRAVKKALRRIAKQDAALVEEITGVQ